MWVSASYICAFTEAPTSLQNIMIMRLVLSLRHVGEKLPGSAETLVVSTMRFDSSGVLGNIGEPISYHGGEDE